MRKTRVFIDKNELSVDVNIKLDGNDFDHLVKVMRKKLNDEIYVFNGKNGEFIAKITGIDKKSLNLAIIEKVSDLKKATNITLAFAPVKNVRIDFVATKATELGVKKFQPIVTQHTIVNKINRDRFKANIKEACQQCERNDFPEILEIKKLEKILDDDKIFILCDESGKGKQAKEFLPNLDHQNKEFVILIGPEGGFSREEFTKMQQRNIFSLNLGPRILRSDTAIISALTLVQEFLGDFNQKPRFSDE